MGLVMTPRLGATPQLDTPGFFGGDSGISYEELQARKRIAQELMRGNGQIRTVGEGINSAAGSIAGALMKRRVNKEEGKQRDSFNEAFNSVVPGLFGGSAPPTGTASTKTPDASAPVTPTPSNAEFVEAMMPHALRVSEQTGIDPRVVIAQAALETGWGKSAPGNNYFGIKSHGRKGGNTLQTTEFSNGRQVGVKDSFRAYRGMGESADDYAAFLKANPRYAPMLGAPDMEGQINALAESGYATDPQYGAKIRSIAAGIPMDGSLTARASTQSAPAGIRTAQAGSIDPTIIQQLAQLAGSPYANDGQRAIVQALLGQQLKAMPPQYPKYQFIKDVGVVDMNNPPPEVMAGAFDGSTVDPTEYGVTPQYIVREDGSLGMVVLGKDGTAKEVELPEGAAVQKGVEKLDLGTAYQWYNTLTGEEIGQPIPKDIAAAEAEKARGKAEGEADVANRAELPKIEAQSTEAINLIDSIMNDPALASVTGNVQGNLPAGIPFITGGQAGANLMPKIRQLQGQVFLQAYESLRGAQAITDVEGRKATEAKARLDRAQDEKTYREALMELRDIVMTGLARSRAKAGVSATAPTVEAPTKEIPTATHRFNPETGKVEPIQ